MNIIKGELALSLIYSHWEIAVDEEELYERVSNNVFKEIEL
jgi:hypothetical protein